jgi:hypothetical protein
MNDKYEILLQAVEKFVDKNFHGGSKSSREDYVVMVTAKDIYDLREALRQAKGE